MNKHKRSSFSGKLGFVLSAAGASVGRLYQEVLAAGIDLRK